MYKYRYYTQRMRLVIIIRDMIFFGNSYSDRCFRCTSIILYNNRIFPVVRRYRRRKTVDASYAVHRTARINRRRRRRRRARSVPAFFSWFFFYVFSWFFMYLFICFCVFGDAALIKRDGKSAAAGHTRAYYAARNIVTRQ